MKRDIAERFAATSVEKVTTEQVQKILRELLTWLARCPVCEDDGAVTFSKSAHVVLDGHMTNVPLGTAIPCPRCGGLDESGNRRHDPEYVIWHCFAVGVRIAACTADQPHPEKGHERCGYQVMLPVPEPES